MLSIVESKLKINIILNKDKLDRLYKGKYFMVKNSKIRSWICTFNKHLLINQGKPRFIT